ncbi:MAG: hypothetical protein ACPL5I_13790 [Thermodesulfobacteriota bacterium]
MKLFNFLKRNELEQILKKSTRRGHKKFLLVWNRGLGDIALGVWGIVQKIKESNPNAEITILTRPDLEEGFYLLENVKTVVVPNWKRGKPINLIESLSLCGMKKENFDTILEKVNPTSWLKDDLGNFIPKLKWREEYDQLWKKFNLTPTIHPHIAVHLNTETEEFYGYNKNWPQNKFIKLFDSLLQEMEIRIIFLGLQKKQFWQHPAILDLRGETTILEMLSIIKNCCPLLIAPDGGVLSLIYYLDVNFPLTIISLWGDAQQGILKQSVPSPNPRLKHIPIIGPDKDITAITTENVLAALRHNLKESFEASLASWKSNI